MRITFEHGNLHVLCLTDGLISNRVVVEIMHDAGMVRLRDDSVELLRDILNTILEITGGDNK